LRGLKPTDAAGITCPAVPCSIGHRLIVGQIGVITLLMVRHQPCGMQDRFRQCIALHRKYHSY